MMLTDYKSRRRNLLLRMFWAAQAKLDARIEARNLKRSQLHYVRVGRQ